MNKVITLLAVALFAFSFSAFAGPGEEDMHVYESRDISYSVEKVDGKVYISLQINDVSSYDMLEIVRSDSPINGFRRVLHFNEAQLTNFSSQEVVVDHYPLPTSVPSYYKVVVSEKEGAYKKLPGVLLSAN